MTRKFLHVYARRKHRTRNLAITSPMR